MLLVAESRAALTVDWVSIHRVALSRMETGAGTDHIDGGARKPGVVAQRARICMAFEGAVHFPVRTPGKNFKTGSRRRRGSRRTGKASQRNPADPCW